MFTFSFIEKMLKVIARKPYPKSRSLELTMPRTVSEVLDVHAGELVKWNIEIRNGRLVATVSKAC